jgi:uncharacterized Zn-binding protein involved in type VI secretion
MPAVVRVGDAGSHGGAVVSGSPDTRTNGKQTARVGDIYGCPIHGLNPIVTGSQDVLVNGRRVARVGDQTACGATLVSGSPDTFAN